MTYERLNPPFNLSLGELEEKIGIKINENFGGYNRVIPLREIKETHAILLFTEEQLMALIRKIPLRPQNGEPLTYPYEHAKVDIFGREPKGLMIGQKFVVRKNLLSMMDELSTTSKRGVFKNYVVRGLSEMPPLQIYGLGSNGEKAVAFYIPPLVEIQGNHAVLLDGIHRSYICATAGTAMNSIHLSGTDSFTIPPMPFKPLTWQDIQLVEERPSVDKRYENLKREYFRDLSAVGIDG